MSNDGRSGEVGSKVGGAVAAPIAVLQGLARSIRPNQWYKQSILLLGITFSGQLGSASAWGDALVAVAAFTAVAGATYVFNDINDREADRNHPIKRHRPIASGQVGVWTAGAFATGLFAAGIGAAVTVDPVVAGLLLAYVAQNVAYSVWLKRVVVADILVIAGGFVLRAAAGVVAVDASLSPWLLLCTFLAALLLALGKRRHELRVSEEPEATRTTLAQYTAETVDQFMLLTLDGLLVSYSMYTFFGTVDEMMATVPFAFFGAFRYHLLVQTDQIGGDPAFLLFDRPFVSNLSVWGVVVVVLLYAPSVVPDVV